MPLTMDPLYLIIVGPVILFMLYAQFRVKSAYSKWEKVPNEHNLSGPDAAQKLMHENGLSGLNIQGVAGKLTDSYDPRSKTLNLSEGTVKTSSVASLAIVAHELGHAQQDQRRSILLQLRSGLVPAVNIGSQLGPILFLAGLLLNLGPLSDTLMWVGIGLFSLSFIFALVTLPIELDASARAMKMLKGSGLLVGDKEIRGARAVLNAAALTYVAAMLMALAQLVRYILLARGGKSRSRR